MSEVYLLLFASMALAVAWFIAQPPAVFVVAVRGGNVEARRGKVTDSFLAAVSDVCREFEVDHADIRGVARGERIVLRFSSSLPEAARQRLRNWWAISGWLARPRSRSR